MPQTNIFAPYTSFAGSQGTTRMGQQKDAWTSDRHGKYYNSVYGIPAVGSSVATAGAVFRGSNSAGATLSAALATTYVGLCLSNPAGNTLNLVVRSVSGVIIIAPAGMLALGLITGWAVGGVTAHTTAIQSNITTAYVGAATSSGSVKLAAATTAKLDAAATLVGTPVWDRWLSCNAATTNNVTFYQDLNDDLIIPPGGYVAVGANAAGPAAGFLGTFEWEEVAP